MRLAQIRLMIKSIPFKLVRIAVLIVSLVTAFYALNRLATGRLGFYVWKVVSGEAHGGQYVNIDHFRIYFETYGHGTRYLSSMAASESSRTCSTRFGRWLGSDLSSRWIVAAMDGRLTLTRHLPMRRWRTIC